MTISVKEFVKGEYLTAEDLNAALTTLVDEVNRVAALPPEGQKNYIINGDFSIWQRGTSHTSSGYGAADRWVDLSSGSTKTASQQAFTAGQTDVPGNPKYYSRTVVNSVAGAGNFAYTGTRVEDVTKLSGEVVTLSFWAKADTAKDVAIEMTQNFGSGGSSSVNEIGVTTVSLTTSWVKYAVNITLPSVSGKTIGADNFLQITVWFDAGSNYDARTNSLGQQSGTFDIANVQLEKGDTATDFEYIDEATQLARCQRYYVDLLADHPSPLSRPLWNVNCFTTTQAYGVVHLPVQMRAEPSLDISNVAHVDVFLNGGAVTATNTIITSATALAVEILVTTSGLPAGSGGWTRANNASTRIGFEAEL